jgi:hypothetical protein
MPGLSQTAEKGGRRCERTGQLHSCWQLFVHLLFLHLGLLQHRRLFKNVKLPAIATALGRNEVAAVPSDVSVMLRQSEVAAVPSHVRVMLNQSDVAAVLSDVSGVLRQSEVAAVPSDVRVTLCQSEVAAVPSDVRAMLRQSEVAAVLDVVTAVPNGNYATEVLSEADVNAIFNRCDVTGSLGRSDVTAVPRDVTTSAALLVLQLSPGGLQRAAEAVWRGPLQVLEAGQPREVGGVLGQLRF